MNADKLMSGGKIMKKVITYGTFDLLHFGHVNLLKHAKELGDYLIVGVTTENFDISRGKLNVQQPLMERIQAVKDTGYADEVIIEEYEGQKIDDIKKYGIDIFAIGSDWVGTFDYLDEFCEVIYLERTKGISSTQLRTGSQLVNIGIVGYCSMVDKFIGETKYVSGIEIKGIYPNSTELPGNFTEKHNLEIVTDDFNYLLDNVDAVYIISKPKARYEYIKQALLAGKHVICETPVTLRMEETKELYKIAEEKGLIIFEALKTAYSLAFSRLILLVKGGLIGAVKSVEAACTSLKPTYSWSFSKEDAGGSLTDWGPFPLLAIFKILGLDYEECEFTSFFEEKEGVDLFTKVDFKYPHAVATAKVGIGVKSEGELIISGTKAYIYVPSPWWKMDYFEVRFENFSKNRRYFYKFEGEGIRYELAEFLKAIRTKEKNFQLEEPYSIEISRIMEEFLYKDNMRKRVI